MTKYLNGEGIDNKLRVQTGSDVKYFLSDHLGSTNALTNSSGAITEQTAYDAFGNATTNLSTRYQFTGREFDSFTNLHYYRARFYDTNLGRFISEDPIGFAGGDVNLFAYVGNNSINRNDPTGKFWHIIAGAAIGGIGNAAFNALFQLATPCHKFDWSSVGNAFVAGAIAGGASAAVPFAAGYGILGNYAANAGMSAAISGGSQAAANLLTGHNVSQGVAASAVSGGIAGGFFAGSQVNFGTAVQRADKFLMSFGNGVSGTSGNAGSSLLGYADETISNMSCGCEGYQ